MTDLYDECSFPPLMRWMCQDMCMRARRRITGMRVMTRRGGRARMTGWWYRLKFVGWICAKGRGCGRCV